MSTENRRSPQVNARVLLGTGAAAAGLGVLVGLVGLLVQGTAAVYGALLGTALTVAVLWGGATVVDLVAGVLPSASLLVAVLTYALQLLVLLVALGSMSGSELLAGPVDGTWLGVAVIAVTVAWLVVQIVLTTRRRIPAYDLGTGGQ